MNSSDDDELKFEIGRIITGFSPFILIFLSFILNSLNFYIYSQETFAKTSATFYLKALAIFDTLSLLQNFSFSLPYSFGIDLKVQTVAMCKILNSLGFSVCAVSSWLETIVSIDRCLSIAYINKFSFLNKRWFKYLVLSIAIAFNFVYYLPIIIFFDVVTITNTNTTEDSKSCVTMDELYSSILGWSDLVNSTFMPFLLMFVSTIVIVRSLVSSRKRSSSSHKQPKMAPKPATQQSSYMHGSSGVDLNIKSATTATASSSTNTSIKKSSKSREEKEFQFALVSVTMNILFFFFNLFLCIYNIYSSYVQMSPGDSLLFFSLASLLFNINFTFKFFIYYIINTKFRAEVHNTIALIKKTFI